MIVSCQILGDNKHFQMKYLHLRSKEDHILHISITIYYLSGVHACLLFEVLVALLYFTVLSLAGHAD